MVGLCSASALAFTVSKHGDRRHGEPLIGVTVRVEGVAGGTVTDIDGVYKIEVPNPKKDVLTFTYVGMNQTSEKVNSREVVNIVMKSSDEALEELCGGRLRTAEESLCCRCNRPDFGSHPCPS